MKIICYIYDHINNPILGGGGSLRIKKIHEPLSKKHKITIISGAYRRCKNYTENNIHYQFLGFKTNYLLSRISFAVLANIHSIFAKADLFIVSYSVFSPVLTFLWKREKTIVEFFHFVGWMSVKKYNIFGFIPIMFEKLVLHFGKYFITINTDITQLIRKKYKKIAIAAYTGVDDEAFQKNTKDQPYILVFGRIDVQMKGLDIMMDVYENLAKKYSDLGLMIGGRGSDKDVKYLLKKRK